MADSNITKRALAAALKELIEVKPFSKISISDICEKCEMNRKSFYYHFKDKYDLVNWIYYTEFILTMQREEPKTGWKLLEELCNYFDQNRSFYRKTLDLEGQNSFSEYFRNILVSVISDDIERIFGKEEADEFYVDFYADAFLAAIKRWLLQKDCVSSKEFVNRLRKCLLGVSKKLAEVSSRQSCEEKDGSIEENTASD